VAVAGARLLYGLPYVPATMSTTRDGARIDYASRRRAGPAADLSAAWSVGERAGVALPGTRDHFLVERYALYVERFGAMWRARVRHRPYPLHHASIHRLSQSLLRAAGLPEPGGQPLAHHSPGVDVDILWLERVAPGRTRPGRPSAGR
jgi:uncharacterized protein YqjF (DUF2071 family)